MSNEINHLIIPTFWSLWCGLVPCSYKCHFQWSPPTAYDEYLPNIYKIFTILNLEFQNYVCVSYYKGVSNWVSNPFDKKNELDCFDRFHQTKNTIHEIIYATCSSAALLAYKYANLAIREVWVYLYENICTSLIIHSVQKCSNRACLCFKGLFLFSNNSNVLISEAKYYGKYDHWIIMCKYHSKPKHTHTHKNTIKSQKGKIKSRNTFNICVVVNLQEYKRKCFPHNFQTVVCVLSSSHPCFSWGLRNN